VPAADAGPRGQSSKSTHLATSQAYWREAFALFVSIFVRNNDVLLRRRAPPPFLARVVQHAKRLVRLLLCYPGSFAADHVMAFEVRWRSKRPWPWS
jgi:hypothetical protein